ncbi:MAG TPA: hypothetical protein VHT75_19595 [Acidimicrobiales bacterium]|nr:hypothetical protein [Acidimicrobiales bacterium]
MVNSNGATLAITLPVPANLGTVPSGTLTLSAPLGAVTVSASGLLVPGFVATVTSTDFTTGSGLPAQTIPKADISYWSGLLIMYSGGQTAVPGQASAMFAQPLSAPVTAFTSTGLLLVFSISTTWIPTIVIAIPPAAVAGTYTGTITHSVA